MIYQFLRHFPNMVMALGACISFGLTVLGLAVFKDRLPADEGREFAVDGKLSKGKPRGAGIVFVTAYAIGELLFAPLKIECLIYAGLVIVEMLTGYLDDKAEKPWGRLKKGLLDFGVALVFAFTYVHYNGNQIRFWDTSITIPVFLMYILIVVLVWVSINVTNCADGVDGLSGTLGIITMIGFLVADMGHDILYGFTYQIVYFAVAVLAYLWFNAGPSILMMGDAGSRAMGLFLSIVAMKSGHPLLYIPFAAVLIADGGIGLLKVSIIKLFKVNVMKNLRTPLHDHVRKNIKTVWSNNQCVVRFGIIQTIIIVLTIYICMR